MMYFIIEVVNKEGTAAAWVAHCATYKIGEPLSHRGCGRDTRYTLLLAAFAFSVVRHVLISKITISLFFSLH